MKNINKGFKGLMTVILSIGVMFGGLTSIASAATLSSATSLKAIGYTPTSITVSFHNVPGSTGTIVSLGRYVPNNTQSKLEYYSDIVMYSTKSKTMTHTFTGLKANTIYIYQIEAFINNYESIGCKHINVTSAPNHAGNVNNVKTIKTGNTSLRVIWNKVPNASGYEVYSFTSAKGAYTMISRVNNGSTTSFNKGALAKGRTYYFKVRAFNSNVYTRSYSNYWSNGTAIRA